MVTTTGTPGPQRHRVVRRVQDVGADLLGDQRQAGLLPGQPGRPVRDRGRAGDDLGVRRQPGVPLRVGALADDGEVGSARRPAPRSVRRRSGRRRRGRRGRRSRRRARGARVLTRVGSCCLLGGGTSSRRIPRRLRRCTAYARRRHCPSRRALMSPGWSRAATARARPRTTSSGRPAPDRPMIRSARPVGSTASASARASAAGSSRGATRRGAAGHLDQRRRVRDDHRHPGGHRLQRPAARTPRPGSARPAPRPGAARRRGRRRTIRPSTADPAGRQPELARPGRRVDAAPAGLPDQQQRQVRRRRVGQRRQQHVKPLARLQRGHAEQVAPSGRPSRAARRSASGGGSRARRPTPSPTTTTRSGRSSGRCSASSAATARVGTTSASAAGRRAPAIGRCQRTPRGVSVSGWVHGTASCTVTTSGRAPPRRGQQRRRVHHVAAAGGPGRRRAPRPRPAAAAAAAAGAAPAPRSTRAAGPTSRCQAVQPVTPPRPARSRRAPGQLAGVPPGAAGHRREHCSTSTPTRTAGPYPASGGMATGGSVRPCCGSRGWC